MNETCWFAIVATALMLASPNVVFADEVETRKHAVGFSARCLSYGGTYELGEYSERSKHPLSGGVAFSYRFRTSKMFSLGLDSERWFLRHERHSWYALGQRLSVVAEWAFRLPGRWNLMAACGLGGSMLHTHGSYYHYAGIGPAASALLGVRKWVGTLAVRLDLGAQADWRPIPLPSTNNPRADPATGLLWVGLGIETRL